MAEICSITKFLLYYPILMSIIFMMLTFCMYNLPRPSGRGAVFSLGSDEEVKPHSLRMTYSGFTSSGTSASVATI